MRTTSAPTNDPLMVAVALHKQGRLDQAEPLYLDLLKKDPRNADVLQYLGLLNLQRGQTDKGVDFLKEAVAIAPQHFAALNNLGNALISLERYLPALEAFDKALLVQPDAASIWHNRGRALLALERYQDACQSFSKALEIAPDFLEAKRLLPKAWLLSGSPAEALSAADSAIRLMPDDAELHHVRGVALRSVGRLEEALLNLNRASTLKPGVLEILFDKGVVLARLHREKEALAVLDQVLASNDNLPGAHLVRAFSLSSLGRPKEALIAWDRAIELNPGHVLALVEKSRQLLLMGRNEEARTVLSESIRLEPGDLALQLRHAVAWVPILRHAGGQVETFREHFRAEVQTLIDRVSECPVADPANVARSGWPFYLAYQERNNRPLLSLYGELCVRLMQQWEEQRPRQEPVNRKTTRQTPLKRRVGIFSAQIQEHSVWRAIVRGWVCELDRQRFDVCIFYHGYARDAQTALAEQRAEEFVSGERDVADWARCLEDAKLDVLLYPDIGMDGMTQCLASLRLAPVQIASWGHPETTGLSTIDYYLSAELFESNQSDDYYTEKLVRLPHLGCCFESTFERPEAVALESWGVRPDASLFVCPGAPFKYTPEHDAVFVRIAQRVSSAQFLFFNYELTASITEDLLLRLKKTFEAQGLDAQRHLVLAPWQTRGRFYSVLSRASAFLDTIGFSGFNTVMYAVDCGLPVVTQRGQFMRGRFGSAILDRMGLGDLVCEDDEDYVALAVRLACDAEERARIQSRIVASRHVLYGDREPIRAMETLFASF